MLQEILSPSFEGDFIDRLVSWENQITKYESQSKQRIGDDIRTAILLRNAPQDIKVYLQVSMSTLDTYAKTRAAVEQYMMARRTWSGPGASSSSNTPLRDSSAMEVDAMGKKGFGRGKGRQQQGQQGKPADRFGSKGQGAGKGFPDQKGQKGSSKGAGKTNQTKDGRKVTFFEGNCHKCGKWGHRAADCFKNALSVQAVEENSNDAQVNMLGADDEKEWVMGLTCDSTFLRANCQEGEGLPAASSACVEKELFVCLMGRCQSHGSES